MYNKPFLTYFAVKRTDDTEKGRNKNEVENITEDESNNKSIIQCATRTFTKSAGESSDSDVHYDLFYITTFNN